MLKPAKQPHIRLTALFLCVTMFLSTLFFNAHTAYAADGTIDYKAGAKIPYGDYYTSRMSFDGNNTAYCVEPLKKTPLPESILITFWEKIPHSEKLFTT